MITVADMPFVKELPHDGRLVFVAPYYDCKRAEWSVYIELTSEKGKFLRMSTAWPATDIYLAEQPERPKQDPELPFGTFITQRFSFPGINGPFGSIVSDVQNLACILEKYRVLSTLAQEPSMTSLLLETEVEYLLFVVRSVYDLLQLISRNVGQLVRNASDPTKRPFPNLPDDFKKICINDNRLLTSAEIRERWGLPGAISDFYAAEAPYFNALRITRNRVAHHGYQLPSVFCAAEGMAIDPQKEPWSLFNIWKRELSIKNGLASLRFFIAYVVHRALSLPTGYLTALVSCFASTPTPVHPNIKCYLKHPFGSHLVNLDEYLERPWERA